VRWVRFPGRGSKLAQPNRATLHRQLSVPKYIPVFYTPPFQIQSPSLNLHHDQAFSPHARRISGDPQRPCDETLKRFNPQLASRTSFRVLFAPLPCRFYIALAAVIAVLVPICVISARLNNKSGHLFRVCLRLSPSEGY
jgi:hypothetical protein